MMEKKEKKSLFKLPQYVNSCDLNCPECYFFNECVEDTSKVEDTFINEWWIEK